MLGAFDISYLPRTAMKRQVLTDLVAEFTEELNQVGPEEVGTPKEAIRMNLVTTQQTWQLFVDRAANEKGSGVGIVIISPEGITLEKSLRLSVSATNNEAEYKALQAGLIDIQKLEVNLLGRIVIRGS